MPWVSDETWMNFCNFINYANDLSVKFPAKSKESEHTKKLVRETKNDFKHLAHACEITFQFIGTNAPPESNDSLNVVFSTHSSALQVLIKTIAHKIILELTRQNNLKDLKYFLDKYHFVLSYYEKFIACCKLLDILPREKSGQEWQQKRLEHINKINPDDKKDLQIPYQKALSKIHTSDEIIEKIHSLNRGIQFSEDHLNDDITKSLEKKSSISCWNIFSQRLKNSAKNMALVNSTFSAGFAIFTIDYFSKIVGENIDQYINVDETHFDHRKLIAAFLIFSALILFVVALLRGKTEATCIDEEKSDERIRLIN